MKSITLTCLIEDKELYSQILQILNEKICSMCLYTDCTVSISKQQDQNVCISIQENCVEVNVLQPSSVAALANIEINEPKNDITTTLSVVNPTKIDTSTDEVPQLSSPELILNKFLQNSKCTILSLDSKTLVPASFDNTLDKTTLFVDKVVFDNDTVVFIFPGTSNFTGIDNVDNMQQSCVFRCPIFNQNNIDNFKLVNNPELTASSIYANINIENDGKICNFSLIICVEQCEQIDSGCKLVFGKDMFEYLQTL